MAGPGKPGLRKGQKLNVPNKKANSGSFVKGQVGTGRPKGVPNKATQTAREAIALFVDGNTDRLQGWLDKIAEEDGAKSAFQCFMDVVEYHVPKLARTELTGPNNGPLQLADVTRWTDAELLEIIQRPVLGIEITENEQASVIDVGVNAGRNAIRSEAESIVFTNQEAK